MIIYKNICKICSKNFDFIRVKKTCCLECQYRYLSKLYKGKPSRFKGIKLSEEHKRKLRNSHWLKNGGIHPLKGKHHMKESIEKMRRAFKGIPLSEEHRMRISEYWRNNKEKHNHWKGGITPLAHEIRNSQEGREWRKKIFERDNYTCQECYRKNGSGESISLEAHHKIRFSTIFSEFLKEYSQFSPIEDKETLLRLSFSYKPFWEIDNGQTLCNECHDKTRGRIKNTEALYEDA